MPKHPIDDRPTGLAQVRHADKSARALRRVLAIGDRGKGHGQNGKPDSEWKRARAKLKHNVARLHTLRGIALRQARIQ